MSSITRGGNAGILRQIQESGKREKCELTTEIFDDFLDELSKKNKMSNRKNKRPLAKGVSEETIKSMFELYKPNKLQLFIMKWVGLNAPFTGNKKRIIVLAELLGLTVDKILEYELKFYLNGKGYTY
jgi:hypothetical protein